MAVFGSVWPYSAQYGRYWPQYGRYWPQLDRYWPQYSRYWPQLDRYWPQYWPFWPFSCPQILTILHILNNFLSSKSEENSELRMYSFIHFLVCKSDSSARCFTVTTILLRKHGKSAEIREHARTRLIRIQKNPVSSWQFCTIPVYSKSYWKTAESSLLIRNREYSKRSD